MIYNEKPDNFIPDIEVVGCVIEYENEILLLHRLPNKSQGGKWGIPAGKIDEGDNGNKKLAILREIQEETGLIFNKEDISFYKTFFVEYPDKRYFYHYHKINIKEKPSIIIKEDEHQAFKWVTVEAALEMPLVMEEDHCMKHFYGI